MASGDIIRNIAFSQIKGLDLSTARELTERIGGVDAFFDTPQENLWQKIGAVKTYCSDGERQKTLSEAAEEANFISKNNIDAIFYDDPRYSQRLTMCDDAPAMLYRLGQCNLNAENVIGIVGTRNATSYGVDFTKRLISDLATAIDDLVVVSGLAYGIDVSAHRAALAANVPTVGVVAHGLRTIYPSDHRDIASRMVHNGGAIVTEYQSTAPIHRGNFLARNRIVAGLCDALIVVESAARGGALFTAKLASNYNREVCAVPGRATDRYSAGCNALIATNRASMIRNADDLIELMGWTAKSAEGEQTSFDFAELSKDVQAIIAYLRANPEATINDMTTALSMPFPTLSAKITEMELDDLITALPGGKYQINV